jgi:serine/threonine-protein kinase
LHEAYARDPEFVSMLLDEARVAGRVRHSNVVQTLDVLEENGEVFIVMEYVDGESLSRLVRTARQREEEIPFPIIAALGAGMLHGLHAAHEANDARGQPLGLVHRDVSPQNVLVGADGLARVIDFGIAKAAGRMRASREGQMKGKFAYMAPEQLRGEVTRQTDVFAAGIVLWEAITRRNLLKDGRGAVDADPELSSLDALLHAVTTPPRRPSEFRHDVPSSLEEIVLRALRSDPAERFASAREMALALESAIPIAAPSIVGEWLERLAADKLRRHRELVAEMEARSVVTDVTPEAAGGIVTPTPSVTPIASTAHGVELGPTLDKAASTRRRLYPAILWVTVAVVAALIAARSLSLRLARVDAAVTSPPSASSPAPSAPSISVAVVQPSASAIVEAPPPPARSSRPPKANPVRSNTGKSPSTRPADSCDPPYETSPSGQRLYKKQCL